MKGKEEEFTENLEVVKLKLQSEKVMSKSLENKPVTREKQSKALKAVCLELKKLLNGTIAREPAERHQYPVFIVSSSINLYVRARYCFRGVVDIPSYLNESFGRKPEKIPGRNSIGNQQLFCF
ncbi:hypothetical protein Barb6_02032 [Bacteroidales bacterium Barb6]|nr:hypothetical protein Barb6_02032 [Bacteroidales bacterium Barb6]